MLQETAQKLGIEPTQKDPARRMLNFASEEEEDNTARDTSKPSRGAKETEAPHRKGVDQRFDSFRSNYGPYQHNNPQFG
jgi:hypothetical protein